MMLSLNSNSSTNWITSFDLGKYNEFSDSFEVDDRIYISIKGTFDQFWVFKLFFNNGNIDTYKWYKHLTAINSKNMHYNVVISYKIICFTLYMLLYFKITKLNIYWILHWSIKYIIGVLLMRLKL